MAKATAQEAALTRQKIIDTALLITLEQGFDKVTLGNIAKAIPMSRSGINTHFAKKDDIARELEPILTKILYQTLDFNSCEAFYHSWVKALHNSSEFRSSISVLGPIIPPDKGFTGLMALIQGEDKQMIEATIYRAIGYAVVNLPQYMAQD